MAFVPFGKTTAPSDNDGDEAAPKASAKKPAKGKKKASLFALKAAAK